MGNGWGGTWQPSWGGTTAPPSVNQWNNSKPTPAQQAELNDNSLWAQVMTPQANLPGFWQMGSIPSTPPATMNVLNPPQPQQYSTLPVPYSTDQQRSLSVLPQGIDASLMPAGEGQTRALQPLPDATSAAVGPVLPLEEPLYIPPMYTKPRAIIPRYRAISGLISVLIMFTLLCTGAGYYAKATGKLSFLHQLYGEARPRSLKVTPTAPLALPTVTYQYGPASNIITSATTTSRINPTTYAAQDQNNVFQTNQIIYLTYSVHPNMQGTVIIKWYTNNVFYQASQPIVFSDMKPKNGYAVMKFSQPVEGMVDLYWNNQLAVRLYFLVQ